MDVCSKNWRYHYQMIYQNWRQVVTEDDIVLVPGDISWASKLPETIHDMNYLSLLPGRILAVQGNHDYWWQSVSQVRNMIPTNMQVIQNDHVIINKIAFCGTRGWLCPYEGKDFTTHNEKIYQREILRLENSLKSVQQSVDEIIVLMHYMPTNESHQRSGFIDVLTQYNVSTVVYGHLHAHAHRHQLPPTAWGINFHLVSADYVKFAPALIRDV